MISGFAFVEPGTRPTATKFETYIRRSQPLNSLLPLNTRLILVWSWSVGLALFVAVNSVVAQTVAPVTNWRIERATLDQEFAERLQEIGLWCRENNLPQQIPATFDLLRPHDLQRQYIFLPSENSLPVPPEGALGEWLTKINAIKVWQGERIFELAKRAATAEAGGSSVSIAERSPVLEQRSVRSPQDSGTPKNGRRLARRSRSSHLSHVHSRS